MDFLFLVVVFSIIYSLFDTGFCQFYNPGSVVIPEVPVIKWCITTGAELMKCNDISAAVKEKKFDFQSKNYFDIECVQASTKEDCMKYLESSEADLMVLDPGDVFIGGRYHSLIPIMKEVYKGGLDKYFSVAVIKRGTLPGVSNLFDLKHLKACFAGTESLAGWVIPVAQLMKHKAMSVVDCNNHVKSVSQFFGKSCAVNCLSEKFNPLGENSHHLCELCNGTASGEHCTSRDPYAGYNGALHCLIEKGDIAFMKHSALLNIRSTRRGLTENDFELLCLDGRRLPVSEYMQCNWGDAPSHAVVISSAHTGKKMQIQKFLTSVVDILKRKTSASNKYSSEPSLISINEPAHISEEDFYIFTSFDKYNQHDVIFQDDTVNLVPIPNNDQLFERYLGASLHYVFDVRDCPVKVVSLCVVSEYELKKCTRMKTALKAQLLQPDLNCFKGRSQLDCMMSIQGGDADVAVLDAGDVYTAGYQYDLIPLLVEHYNLKTPEYYSVAVTKLHDQDTDLLYLRGKKTCHTGINHAAGWVLPLSFLITNDRIRSYDCDAVRAASEFFTKSCVPGALRQDYNHGEVFRNLCDLCHGASYKYCIRDPSEDYFGPTGAFRCLVEGGGDVAFVRHTTVLENTEGKRKDHWARNQLKRDYELLCRDGTRKPVTEYERCNLGKLPGNAVVVRGGPGYNQTQIDSILNLFMYAQQFYGLKQGDEFKFKMFNSDPPLTDLIFQDATQKLQIIPPDKRNYRDFLGEDFLYAKISTDCTAGSGHAAFLALLLIFPLTASIAWL